MWRNLAGVFGTNVLAKLASVVALVGIVRTLSEAQFARYTVAYTVYGMLSGFVFIALNFGMVRSFRLPSCLPTEACRAPH